MESLPHAIGGAAVVAIYFCGIMLIGAVFKSIRRGSDNSADTDDRTDERRPDYFADLRERGRHDY